jgi:DNA-binding transcriptional LysR family regulator
VRGFDAIAQAVEAGPGVAEMPATTAEPLARLHAVDALAQESPAGDLP